MTQKALKAYRRSGFKVCAICSKVGMLERHHINGRKLNKAHSKWNVCDMCPNCHSDTHLGNLVVEGWFNTSDGYQLIWHKKLKE